MKNIAYVGIDYHQAFLAVVVLPEGENQPVDKVKLENDPKKIKKYMSKLSKRYEIKTCYEASSCGYFFYRQMASWGYSCEVIAPSKIPQKPGDRVKTDFKDAENIAYQFRNGSLTYVHVPKTEEEEVRALIRCRRALKETSKRVKLQIYALLKVQGFKVPGKLGSAKCDAWLRELSLSPLMDQILIEYRTLLEYLNTRIAEMDREIEGISETKPYAEQVKRLKVLRGMGVLSSMILITEIIDFKRFPNPKSLMGFLGLTPSEYSSSGIQKYGGITKAGNSACRKILVECVQHYKKKPKPTITLTNKWKDQPAERVQLALKCMQRLHKRYWALEKRKPKNVATTAIAREFVGFIWSLMQNDNQSCKA
jgi:transposase